MSNLTAEYRASTPRTVWMAARARNAMRRPVFIAAISISAFVAALVAMVVIPYQAQRAAKAIAPRPGERPDTEPLFAAAAISATRLASADSALVIARNQRLANERAIALDTMGAAGAANREAVRAGVAELDDLLGRVENAPLTTSYRALAEARELAPIPAVRMLLDTLNEIEREREGLSVSGGVDPVFVALTARATEVGRAIQTIATMRRDSLRLALGAMTPAIPPPSAAALAAADTTPLLASREAARAAFSSDSALLAAARARVLALEVREQRARELASRTVPPFALLASSLVFGIALGFGVALVDELRRPRVADEHEAERVAGVRVLSMIRPRPRNPDRQRRAADRALPPYIDPGADYNQLLYLHVAGSRTGLLMLTVAGDEPSITAVVAANFTAIAAEEARSALLVDTDASATPVAAALRVRAEPGVVDLIDGRVSWPEATVQCVVGRSSAIDVVPSGIALPLPEMEEVNAILERDAARLARHYETVLVAATTAQALSGLPGRLPITDTILCARIGRTRLSALRHAMDGLREAGAKPLGLVLWDGEPPALVTANEIAAGARRRRNTAEIQPTTTAH